MRFMEKHQIDFKRKVVKNFFQNHDQGEDQLRRQGAPDGRAQAWPETGGLAASCRPCLHKMHLLRNHKGMCRLQQQLSH
jgi:hypothetical protein